MLKPERAVITVLSFLNLFSFCHGLLDGPVVSSNFPDPGLIQVNGTYHAFATANGDPPGVHVQMASSFDFEFWTFHEGYDALPVLPDWCYHPARVWAPDPNQRADGTFILYFTALNKKVSTTQHRRHHCVGAAHSPNVTGPYIPYPEPISCDYTDGGSIDPDGFHDPVTGYDYIVYKVDGNSLGKHFTCIKDVAPTPLQLLRVNSTDLLTPIGDPIDLLMNDRQDGPDIEAPSLIYNKGMHYLVHNSGCFAGKGYTVNYAISRSGVEGPYHRISRPLLITGQKIDSAGSTLYAPGGVDVDPSNSSRIVFHSDTNLSWFQKGRHHPMQMRDRAMFAAELDFGDDEYLSVRGLP